MHRIHELERDEAVKRFVCQFGTSAFVAGLRGHDVGITFLNIPKLLCKVIPMLFSADFGSL